jgi:pyridoxal phosphate enzyme (YggS family)
MENFEGDSNRFQRLEKVVSNISNSCLSAGRDPGSVQLVAVSKSHPPEAIAEVMDAGQMLFGENRVQEAKSKIPQLPAKARWHFIGHLQKNKIRMALPLFEMIQSVDSLELAQQIDRVAAESGLFPRVLLEVNTGGESSKFGFSPEGLRAAMEDLLQLERIQIEGLMTIPPPAPKPEVNRPYFAMLRELRDDLEGEFRISLPELSMGMSDDYTAAIAEGATIVRVGTAIFGKRSSRKE